MPNQIEIILNHALYAYKSLKIVDIFTLTMYNLGEVKIDNLLKPTIFLKSSGFLVDSCW